MTIRERVLTAFDRHKARLGTDTCWANLRGYDNDLSITARWGEQLHAAKVEDFVPPDGLSDEQLDWLVSTCIDGLLRRQAEEAAR
jgi:hypothetical protein